ncbi:HK97 family phage prohead protease [Sinomonas sp. JGH33]|uniref:HK97 family phage prohead protease n=1 Tax=Sinomonas terricola TaxID=3110330 RepID=A0ABU5T492_9MICC|nr:HK97 family phage prohead protease [Sinomonas sp. JGH33]MEA5454479.1 HK97 family phage prohead protease [Sinomonas sp. JGH33]
MNMLEAAQKRAQGVRASADRPSQRRCTEAPGSGPRVAVRMQRIELREAGDAGGGLGFSGYASVTGVGYEMWDMFGPYTEVVSAGAFGPSLARADLDVPLVIQHDGIRRIARTTNGTLLLAEDDHGLSVDAPSLDPDDVDVQYIVPKLRSGLIDEMSFMFRITAGEWSPDWTEFHVNEVDIHRGDVSIVSYGANPATAGSGLRSANDLASFVRGLSVAEQREIAALVAHAAPKTGADLITDEDVRLRRVRL